jgi:flagella basal body P-ring formation protein FlgA
LIVRIAAAFLALALSTPAAAADAVDAAARGWLERSLAREHEQVAIEPASGREALALPAGAVELKPRACGREAPARRMCVRVDVVQDGVTRKSIPVWFKVEARRKVLVASAPVAAGSVFDPRAFALELRDVAALNGAPLAPFAAGGRAGALRVRRPLDAGQVVLASDVGPTPAVARNQEVTIRVQAGAILVETPGVALADGRLGAMVRVRNPRSGEIYDARIVDEGVLAVNLR